MTIVGIRTRTTLAISWSKTKGKCRTGFKWRFSRLTSKNDLVIEQISCEISISKMNDDHRHCHSRIPCDATYWNDTVISSLDRNHCTTTNLRERGCSTGRFSSSKQKIPFERLSEDNLWSILPLRRPRTVAGLITHDVAWFTLIRDVRFECQILIHLQQRSTKELKSVDGKNFRYRWLFTEFHIGSACLGILVDVRRTNESNLSDLREEFMQDLQFNLNSNTVRSFVAIFLHSLLDLGSTNKLFVGSLRSSEYPSRWATADKAVDSDQSVQDRSFRCRHAVVDPPVDWSPCSAMLDRRWAMWHWKSLVDSRSSHLFHRECDSRTLERRSRVCRWRSCLSCSMPRGYYPFDRIWCIRLCHWWSMSMYH